MYSITQKPEKKSDNAMARRLSFSQIAQVRIVRRTVENEGKFEVTIHDSRSATVIPMTNIPTG
jgi:hypothetical protein